MISLKDQILFEDKFNKQNLRRLEVAFNSNKWVTRKPFIFRGRTRDDDVIMVKNSRKKGIRPPNDTSRKLDFLINDFIEKQHTEYPRRDLSRFGTTDYNLANSYGPSVYAIFPHIKTKVAYLDEDSYQMLKYYNNNLKKVESSYKKLYNYEKLQEILNKKIYKVLKSVKNIFSQSSSDISIAQFGEVDELLNLFKKEYAKLMKNDNVSNFRSGVFESLMKNMIRTLKLIKKYLDSLVVGYPEKADVGEVIYEGKYAQVDLKILKNFLEEKEYELRN